MSLLALSFLLAAAVCHASWNYIAKGLRSGNEATFGIVLCSALATLVPAAIVVAWTRPTLDAAAVGFMAVSACIHTGYFYLLFQGYNAGDLSLVYPLARGTGPLFAVIGAVVILGERPTPLAIAGAALIIAGVLTISAPRDLSRIVDARPSIIFALATGVTIATYTLWDKEGVARSSPVLYSLGTDIFRLIILAPVVLGTARTRGTLAATFRDTGRQVATIGLLTPLAYILVLAALNASEVSYVAPAREVSILFGTLLGLRLLAEPHPGQRLAGAAMIVGGVVALALG